MLDQGALKTLEEKIFQVKTLVPKDRRLAVEILVSSDEALPRFEGCFLLLRVPDDPHASSWEAERQLLLDQWEMAEPERQVGRLIQWLIAPAETPAVQVYGCFRTLTPTRSDGRTVLVARDAPDEYLSYGSLQVSFDQLFVRP